MDTDGDEEVSDDEAAAYRDTSCASLVETLTVTVDGVRVPIDVIAGDIRFPEGAGSLPTLRLVCMYEAALAGPLGPGRVVEVADKAYAERIGWREFVVEGDGIAVEGEVTADSVSTNSRRTPRSCWRSRSTSGRSRSGSRPAAPNCRCRRVERRHRDAAWRRCRPPASATGWADGELARPR